MNVLIVGSGAREHALAWKLRQSPRLTDLFVAPGNAGTAAIAHNLQVNASDIDSLCRAASDHRIDLVVVGPEAPLSLGVVDRLAAKGVAAFGPTQAAARIESSKSFAKALMARCAIPTARTATFDNLTDARNYVESLAAAPVVKADGLAAGKGVFVCDSKEEALRAIDLMMGAAAVFGEAGRTVLVEERLSGREVSAHAFTDGSTVAPMPFACDYKRISDGDEGPNTGGVGAYSPALWLDEALERYIHQQITEAAVTAMAEEGTPYSGVLYPGLIVTPEGPKVLEFNCRFGDPEAQVLLPRLKSDLLEICWAVANNRLSEAEVQWSTDACVGVVIASGGYPGEHRTGFEISGLEAAAEVDGALVFHAGTSERQGRVVTAGGRVLSVSALGGSLAEARDRAYEACSCIAFEGMQHRSDIAGAAAGEERR